MSHQILVKGHALPGSYYLQRLTHYRSSGSARRCAEKLRFSARFKEPGGYAADLHLMRW